MIEAVNRPSSTLPPAGFSAALAAVASADRDSLREVLALLPVGVLLLDAAGHVQDANPVAIDLLGVPLLGQRWRDVIRRSFEPRADDGHEISLRDGRRVHLATRAMSSGLGQLVVISDLTETRQLQARLAQRDRLASMGQLMASLAHQLRTPIASALLCAHQLQKQVGHDATPSRHAKRVIERLQHMERQIADMLLVAGGGSPRVETLALSDLLDRLFDIYQPLAQQNGVRLLREVTGEACAIIGNRDALLGALGNLIDNAFHACQHKPAGTAEVRICLQPGEDGRLTISVHDNGSGMSPTVLARLREPFFTTKRTGTGLGLAVVQAVAESHQAALDIRSEAGVGSCFALTLPLAPMALARAG